MDLRSLVRTTQRLPFAVISLQPSDAIGGIVPHSIPATLRKPIPVCDIVLAQSPLGVRHPDRYG
jgi:hypothetical protein